jgi:hypothetical protein
VYDSSVSQWSEMLIESSVVDDNSVLASRWIYVADRISMVDVSA